MVRRLLAGGAVHARRSEALAEANEAIRVSRNFDGLTGLANRRNLIEDISRHAEEPLALLHIDIQDFKAVNETHGWATGDTLLRCVARRLEELALNEETLSRVGGDGFVLASPRRTHPAQLEELAGEIVLSLAQPISLGSTSMPVDVVVGIATRGPAVESGETLLQLAEAASAEAMAAGATVQFATDRRTRLASRRQTAQQLLEALMRDEVEPFSSHRSTRAPAR